MSYTKGDMRTIFRRGALLGICLLTQGEPEAAADEITAGFFEQSLKALRDAKPKEFDATKAIEDWIKRGKPAGEGVIPEFADWLDGK
jgi:hypothetical protein